MKTINLLIYAMLISLLYLLSSCDNPTSKTNSVPEEMEDKEDVMTVSVEDTISLYKFNLYKQNWQTSGLTYSSTKLPISFTMKKVDLTEVLGEQPVGVRFYMGLQQDTITRAHLIAVGVNSKGDDMIDYANGQYAYDVTCPCPDICPGGGGGNVFKCTN